MHASSPQRVMSVTQRVHAFRKSAERVTVELALLGARGEDGQRAEWTGFGHSLAIQVAQSGVIPLAFPDVIVESS